MIKRVILGIQVSKHLVSCFPQEAKDKMHIVISI